MLAHGANKHARTCAGARPIDLAEEASEPIGEEYEEGEPIGEEEEEEGEPIGDDDATEPIGDSDDVTEPVSDADDDGEAVENALIEVKKENPMITSLRMAKYVVPTLERLCIRQMRCHVDVFDIDLDGIIPDYLVRLIER